MSKQSAKMLANKQRVSQRAGQSRQLAGAGLGKQLSLSKQ